MRSDQGAGDLLESFLTSGPSVAFDSEDWKLVGGGVSFRLGMGLFTAPLSPLLISTPPGCCRVSFVQQRALDLESDFPALPLACCSREVTQSLFLRLQSGGNGAYTFSYHED